MTARRVRVLAVLPTLESGGVERHAVTVYPALDRDRFEVRVLCIKDRGALFDEAARSGLAVSSLDAGDGNLSMIRAFGRLLAAVRRFRPDVVTTAGFSADVMGRLAAAVARVPVVLTWKHNCGHVGPYGRRERWAELVLRHVTTRYLAVANAQVPYLTGHLGIAAGRVDVIRNAVATCAPSNEDASPGLVRRELGIDTGAIVIAAVAALRAWKGHATLLRAFRDVLAQERGARLLIIGDGEERQRLMETADRVGLTAAVHFLGDRRDVARLLPAVDVVVLPSYTIECLPYAVLEAMSSARPVVATAIGGLPELVDDGVTGRLVAPGDEHAMARALLEVVCSPDRGAAMGRAGRRRLLEQFPFDTTIRRIEDTFDALVTAAGPARRQWRALT